MAEGDLDVFVTTMDEARAIRDVLESQWQLQRAAIAAELAGPATLARLLTPGEILRVMGPDVVDGYRQAAARAKLVYDASRALDAGKAVLVPWHPNLPGSGVIAIAVVRKEGLPNVGTLGVWPIFVVAGVVGLVTISAAAVLVSKFDNEIQMARLELEALRMKAVDRIAANVRQIAATDPAAAARYMDAARKALDATRAATTDPRGFLDRLFGAMESAVTPFAWLAGLYLVSRIMERRRLAA